MLTLAVISQPLKIVAVLLLVLGAGFLVLAYGALAIDSHSQWYLTQFYANEHLEITAVNGSTPYQRLFRYATVLTKTRGHAQLGFCLALAGACVSLGTVCLLWNRDRRKLHALQTANGTPTI